MKQLANRPVVEYSLRLLITLFPSVIIPIVLGSFLSNSFTLADQTLVGILIGVLGLLIQVVGVLLRMQSTQAKEISLADARDESAKTFAELRKYHDDLVLGQNVLFSAYFDRQIEHLKDEMMVAVTRRELKLSQDMNTTEMMLLPFERESARLVRAVHYLEDNDFLFDLHARTFFHSVFGAVKQKRILKVQRLLIYKEPAELTDDRTLRLAGFHAAHNNYDYRVIDKRDYERIATDSSLPAGRMDFGVYGDLFVYRSTENRGEVSGTFTADKTAIRDYQRVFDRAWNSNASKQLDGLPKVTSLDDLFS